jgi:hypothetical protein
MNRKTFWLNLPVNPPSAAGELREQFERLYPEADNEPPITSNDIYIALTNMAKQYAEYAKVCYRIAGLAAECPDLQIEIEEDILVTGPEDRLKNIMREGLLSEPVYGSY